MLPAICQCVKVWILTLDCIFYQGTRRNQRSNRLQHQRPTLKNCASEITRKVDTFHLRELEEIVGEEASGPVSPGTPENPSRPRIPEIPGPTQTAKGVTFNMATPQGAIGGGVPPIMITTPTITIPSESTTTAPGHG
jgi:hypothetical protein